MDPTARLAAARADVLRLFEPLREPDGSLARHVPMTHATARTPAC